MNTEQRDKIRVAVQSWIYFFIYYLFALYL